jgi:hypothetical protein
MVMNSRLVNNRWHHYNDKNAALVFVHGVLSDSRTCWSYEDRDTSRPSCYWPELIRTDTRFQDVGIYLGGYHTAVDSGDFPLQQCAAEIFLAARYRLTGAGLFTGRIASASPDAPELNVLAQAAALTS